MEKKNDTPVIKRKIALVGNPNSGKSTLFNRLTRTRDAIVADLDRSRAPLHIAIENWQHDLNIGSIVRTAAFFGLDRIVTILCGESSIRDVMAFPKTAAAVDLMSDAPSTVDDKQLRELRIRNV